MHHALYKAFNAGTWFSTFFYFVSEYCDYDFIFKSIMAMLSFTLLVLQIGNQWHVRKERIKNKNK